MRNSRNSRTPADASTGTTSGSAAGASADAAADAAHASDAHHAPGLESVDNALTLLLLLRKNGRLRLSDAADHLGVARSTAHRLLATLRGRGFAVQGADKAYRPGPALYRLGMSQRSDYELVETARPHMLWLNGKLGETVHLVVRSGAEARFLHSIEGTHALRVGSRAGAVLPAHLASAGKALLADLSVAELAEIYGAKGDQGGETDPETLHRRLAAVRRRGYAINIGDTERGLSAVGAAVREPGGRAVAALTVSAPSLRFTRAHLNEAAGVLLEAVRRMETAF
ncbi:IclR family transcriptional regulator [Streptomyces himalayensis]|uniref:IclR family transcriptional regulator n=1 Tax=Streptomyces himalayensis TaxID=2820085 RepID=UPI0028682859|nr:IclR family transcriptional regulator [Streptomyces himalayensis]